MMKWINAASFLIMVLLNALANVLAFGGHTTGQVSAHYPNLFTPAPYTFSIWGIIYALLAVFVILPFVQSKQSGQIGELVRCIGPLFAISCLFNVLWILCWHYNRIALSTICIFGLLLILIFMNIQAGNFTPHSFWEACTKAGIQLYLGWLCAAVIANISVWLTSIGWIGFGLAPQFWTILVILTGALIAAGLIMIGDNYWGALAIVWAYIGILIRHSATTGYHMKYPFVVAALILSVICILVLIRVYIPAFHIEEHLPPDP